MATPSQFRQYLIAQDEEGNNIEVTRSGTQVGVLAFDVERQVFVHCHVVLEPLNQRNIFEERGRKILEQPHRSRVRLFEFGEDEGNAFYITENADGETLRSYLASLSVIPVWLAMRLTVQVLEGMNALLEVGCPLPEQPLESIRVWQSGPHSLKAVVANFPMTVESVRTDLNVKQTRILVAEESEKLETLFSDSMQSTTLGDEALVEAARFAELLTGLLNSFTNEVKNSYQAIISVFETRMPLPPTAELGVSYSPRPLVASLLHDRQSVARSLMPGVRIQSQRVDSVNPYVLRGTLIKTGQAVTIEQVPPERMTGQHCHESLVQMMNLSKIGKFPNLLPVLFLTDNSGVKCMGEPTVDGVALCDILEARRSLDPYEIHLLFSNLNAALVNLETSQRETPRLLLEDIFLFTGSGVPKHEAAGLSRINLGEWPNFSIVLRSHACLHAMAGRGTNPAALLPVKPIKKKDVEPLWHGGWFASLTCMLLGISGGAHSHQRTGIPEIDAIMSLVDDEMKRARKGVPSPRALFLSRYAKQIEKFESASSASAEGWTELSGTTSVPSRASDAVSVHQIPVLGHEARSVEMEQPMIGFAEALIQHPAHDEPEFIGGLRPMRAAPQALPHEDVESSWNAMHEKKSIGWHLMWILAGSMVLGMGLAHLSGRARWQKIIPAETFEIESMEVSPLRPGDEIELPLAPIEPQKPNITKLPVPAPLLKEIDPGGTVPMTDSSRRPPSSAVVTDVPKVVSTGNAGMPLTNPADTADSRLTAQLQMYRNNSGTIPVTLRQETEKAAQDGNKAAMLALGDFFLRGAGEQVDERSAFLWYEKASRAGEIAAALPLAECYLQGWGTKPDLTKAVDLLSKAALTGEARAKDLLAVCYARGIGVTKDDAKAFALFTEAYAAGLPSACGNLGAMYLRGQGTAPDAERAVKLFEEGAKKNHSDSMLLYAQSLEYGTGTGVNVDEAKRWYQKAARLGNAEATSWCRKNSVAY